MAMDRPGVGLVELGFDPQWGGRSTHRGQWCWRDGALTRSDTAITSHSSFVTQADDGASGGERVIRRNTDRDTPTIAEASPRPAEAASENASVTGETVPTRGGITMGMPPTAASGAGAPVEVTRAGSPRRQPSASVPCLPAPPSHLAAGNANRKRANSLQAHRHCRSASNCRREWAQRQLRPVPVLGRRICAANDLTLSLTC